MNIKKSFTLLTPFILFISGNAFSSQDLNVPMPYKDFKIENILNEKEIKDINNMSEKYINSEQYLKVKEDSILITKNKNLHLCAKEDEEECFQNRLKDIALNNYQLGSLRYGFEDMAKKEGDNDSNNVKLFDIVEKSFDEYENGNDNLTSRVLSSVTREEMESSKLMMEIGSECKENSLDDKQTYECIIENSRNKKNIFLNMKMQCFVEYSSGGYLKNNDIENFMSQCINDKTYGENFEKWSGFQFYKIGAILYKQQFKFSH